MDRDDAGGIARSVVGHPYRRILLSYLDSQRVPVPVRDLARAILAFDRSGSVLSDALLADTDVPTFDADADRSAVETMAAQLHHAHLPRLAAVGVVEYDPDAGLVTDWCHPPVGDRWLTAPPVDRLARVIADARTASVRAD
jgi:hypothetical protein